jgi:hypothetical protein
MLAMLSSMGAVLLDPAAPGTILCKAHVDLRRAGSSI